ncbi:MAG: hypothetical protein V4525_07925 [Pseudomonadota bacterium]
MDRVFFFDATGKCQVSKHSINARCIYFNKRQITGLEFFADLEEGLKATDTLPDCMIIIADPVLAEMLLGYWQSESSQQKSFIERGERKGIQYIKSYYFFSWSPQEINQLHGENIIAIDDPCWNIPIDLFIKQGLQQLIKQNNVVQVAPAGHVFRHPSGTINNIFIQTRELAKTEPQLCYVGRAIYGVMQKELFIDLAVVFIDTMSVYHYVREALDFVGSSARIHSFHSYDEVKRLVPPNQAYLVVISASTSGGMARDLEINQKFDPERLLTIIDMSTDGRSGKVLVALNKVDEHHLLIVEEAETEIELVGEHFSSKAKPPRAVTLSVQHAPKDLKKVLRYFGLNGLAGINEDQSKVIRLKPSKDHFDKDFDKWLDEEIRWNVSLAVDHIICTNDDVSVNIAERIAKIIQTVKNLPGPKIIKYAELDEEQLKVAHGVLVVTAIAGDGGLLREISRDLREYIIPQLPRHFLIGVGLPQTIESWNHLRQFLVRNATERRYGFSEWLVLPIGPDHPDNAWKNLNDLASRAQTKTISGNADEKSIAEDSLTKLSEAITACHNGFLQTTTNQLLNLSEGFVFFDDVFKDVSLSEEQFPAAAYLSISSALQSARDTKKLENRLKSSGYESVVLSPECFLRFNDSLLQACLLRACYPSELNYSTSSHFSKLMKEFLIKVFNRHQHPYGAAAIEFAVALATGRLKLKKNDLDEVVCQAKQYVDSSSPSVLWGVLQMLGV